MSAAHRSIARLPVHIFTNLSRCDDNNHDDHEEEEDPRKIKREIVHRLKKHNIRTCGEFLDVCYGDPAMLMRMLDVPSSSPSSPNHSSQSSLTYYECKLLVQRVCSVCRAEPKSALEMLRRNNEGDEMMRYVSTGMVALDACLRGGMRVGSLTEVFGRAGVGKSQLGMQLCCDLALGVRKGGSVYIDSERKLSLRRMQEIARERARAKHGMHTSIDSIANLEYSDIDGDDSHDNSASSIVLNNVTVHNPQTLLDMLDTVRGIESEILERNEKAERNICLSSNYNNKNTEIDDDGSTKKTFDYYPVRLIVIDSIAAVAKKENSIEQQSNDFISTSEQQSNDFSSTSRCLVMLFEISGVLKRIADQLQVAVVIINQIEHISLDSTYYCNDDNNESNDQRRRSSDFVKVSAALGTSWQHCVSTRLLFEHECDPHRQENADDIAMDKQQAWMNARGHVRTATVVKSNVADASSMKFEVNAMGLCEIK